MKIPSPEELGLPDKFASWRPKQEDAMGTLAESQKRISVISAPTGFGKELLCVGTARFSNLPTCIVTASRGLQDQYAKTYKDIGMVDLRGRNNYTCAMKDDPEYSCAEGYYGRCTYKGTIQCPASQAEMRAATSRLVVTNYDKWTHNKRFGQGLSHIQQVIFDEGHSAPEALARAMQVKLRSKEVEDTLGVDFLGGSAAEDMHEWKTWGKDALAIAKDELAKARHKLMTTSDPKMAWVKHFNHMRNLVRKLEVISACGARDWVVEQIEEGFQFDPIRPGRYCESTLLLRVPKIVFVSATIRPKTMYMTGVRKDAFTFVEYDSDFDPKRCPVYWVPTMRVEHGANLTPLWFRLDQIAAARASKLQRNGIIHTISFGRQQEIYQASRFCEDMVINERGEPPTAKVEYFKDRPNTGTMLVSPSIGTGYDFPDDACRWQFICKIPFEPPSKIQKARQADDNEYVYYRAMQYLVQAFGRDIRSKDDWSERFICDDHFGEWFKARYGHLAPKSFHSVYKRADILPQPLQPNTL